MAPMKRPASAGRGAAAKRGRAADPNKAKYEAVAAAVASASGYPKEVVGMLAGNVKACLAQPKDVRHEFAGATLAMVEQVLQSVESGIRSKVTELENTLAASDAERESRDARAKATEASVAEKTEASKAAHAAFDNASQESTKAEAALKTAKREQQEGDAALDATAARKTQLEAVQAGAFAEVKANPSGKTAKAFVHAAKNFGFDEHLMKYAEETLAAAAAERSTFAELVIRELDAAFAAALAAAAETLAGGEAGKAERAAKVKAAEDAVAARAAEQEAAKTAREEAKAALAAAHGEHKAAEKAVKEFGPELKKAASDLEAAKKELERCLATVAGFEELRDRTTPPPPAPEPEEPAAPEAAAAPAEVPAAAA